MSLESIIEKHTAALEANTTAMLALTAALSAHQLADEPAKASEAEAPKKAKSETKPSKIKAIKDEASAAPKAPETSREDVQSALMQLAKDKGKQAAKDVLESFGGAKKIGDLKPADFEAVVQACVDAAQMEAA